jgi:hypothetical protein
MPYESQTVSAIDWSAAERINWGAQDGVTWVLTVDARLRDGRRQASSSSCAMVFYGAANRDERKFKDPYRFDVSRSAAEQLAFGIGAHDSVG